MGLWTKFVSSQPPRTFSSPDKSALVAASHAPLPGHSYDHLLTTIDAPQKISVAYMYDAMIPIISTMIDLMRLGAEGYLA